MAREALCGSLSVPAGEGLYGFADALFLRSDYCIAALRYPREPILPPWRTFYWRFGRISPIGCYLLQDRGEITV